MNNFIFKPSAAKKCCIERRSKMNSMKLQRFDLIFWNSIKSQRFDHVFWFKFL